MALWEHPNKSRSYVTGQIHNASPGDKGFRKPISIEVQNLANEVRRLKELFQLTEEQCIGMVKKEFGIGIGFQTFRMFLNPKYGVAFRPRKTTLLKWQYLKKTLRSIEKELQNSSTRLELKQSPSC